jgi:hypothetical protein
MTKIKLGMIFDSPESYKGGINYFRNFTFALKQVSKNIEILLFVSDKFEESSLNDFGSHFRLVKLSIFRRYSSLWFFDKIFFKIFKSSFVKHNVLKKFDIDVVFTFSPMQKSKFFKILFWLPDLQFLHLPQFFTKSQRLSIIKLIKYMYRQSDTLILSSHTASEDLQDIVGRKLKDVKVLQFICQPSFDFKEDLVSLNFLQKKYDFKKPYFFLPNQFWKHKNHITVFEAMKINKSNDFIVICSGEPKDHRDNSRDHFNKLKNFINTNKLNDKIKILSLIPYSEVISLYKYSVAVINPSFFEGWSSVVEEAKSMHKEIILSNIKVHLEQNPELGHFFDPNNPSELSEVMLNVYNNKKTKKSTFSLKKETIFFGNKISEIIKNITTYE